MYRGRNPHIGAGFFSKGWGTGDKGHTPGSCGTLHLSPSPSMRHVRSYCKMCGSWSLQGSCGRELGGGGLVTLWPLSPTPPVSHPRYPPTGSWEKNYSSTIESYCSLWLPRIPYEMSKITLRGGLWMQRRVRISIFRFYSKPYAAEFGGYTGTCIRGSETWVVKSHMQERLHDL